VDEEEEEEEEKQQIKNLETLSPLLSLSSHHLSSL